MLSEGENRLNDGVLSKCYMTLEQNSKKFVVPYLISVTDKELLLSVVGLHCHNNGMTRVDQQRTRTVPQHLSTATNFISQLPLSTDNLNTISYY